MYIYIYITFYINEIKSPTSAEFSVLVLITFLLKIDILGLAMLI